VFLLDSLGLICVEAGGVYNYARLSAANIRSFVPVTSHMRAGLSDISLLQISTLEGCRAMRANLAAACNPTPNPTIVAQGSKLPAIILLEH
jgi:hypothetical protein